MLTNYLKIVLRNINRHKGYTFINIAGLAIGLTVVILILLYVQFEISFDAYNEKADRIYRVTRGVQGSEEYSPLTPAPLGPSMKNELPEVVETARLRRAGNIVLSYDDKNFFENTFVFADPSTLDMFSLHLLKGDAKSALRDPFSVIISESMARKYFGKDEPIGKTIRYRNRYDFPVTGVMKDMPKNSHLIIDFIAPFEVQEKMDAMMKSTNWGASMYYTYFLVRENTDLRTLETNFNQLLRRHLPERALKQLQTSFQPLRDIHLYPDRIKSVYIFSSIALLVLILACINYMNLATARSTKRMKEIGIRKIIGASRIQLIKQLLGESIVFTVLAFILSMILVWILLPSFNALTDGNLKLDLIGNKQIIIWLCILVATVGVFAGSWPAWAVSSFIPSVLLREGRGGPKGSHLRHTLVVIQFTISIFLIIATLVIKGQLDFIRTADAGFQKDQILVIDIRDENIRRNITAIENELKRNPNILYVSSSTDLPNESNMATLVNWQGKDVNREQEIFLDFVDYDYVDLYGISIIEGRNFSRNVSSDATGAVLINETAMRTIGWTSAIGKEITHGMGNKTGKVVGVMKDFHMNSFHQPIEPLCLNLNLDWSDFGRLLSVKMTGRDVPQTISFIKKTLAKVSPKYPFKYNFFDDLYNSVYIVEERMERAFSIFALLAIFIGSLGVFGLVSFMAEQRTKEIGVRKVLGASVSNVFMLLTKNFIKLVFLANAVAWPLAYYFMNRWLQDFAYKVEIGISIYLLSGAIALVITIVSVSYQAIRVAMANPVDSLRYE